MGEMTRVEFDAMNQRLADLDKQLSTCTAKNGSRVERLEMDVNKLQETQTRIFSRFDEVMDVVGKAKIDIAKFAGGLIVVQVVIGIIAILIK